MRMKVRLETVEYITYIMDAYESEVRNCRIYYIYNGCNGLRCSMPIASFCAYYKPHKNNMVCLNL